MRIRYEQKQDWTSELLADKSWRMEMVNFTQSFTIAPNQSSSVNLLADSVRFHETFAPTGITIDRTISPILYVIGLSCNPLSAYIWLSRKTRRNNSSAIYLGVLSISHFIFLILHIFVELNVAWGIKTYNKQVSCEVFYAFYYIPQYLAPLLILGFTVERYIAVCHPFKKEKFCTVRRAFIVVCALLAFSVCLGLMQAYIWTFDPIYRDCNHREEVSRGGEASFVNVWTWTTELLMFGVVPLAALLFNILVIHEIKSLTNRGPAYQQPGSGSPMASTVTLLSVSFYLICTWLPATLVYSLQTLFFPNPYVSKEEVKDDPTWQRYFVYYPVRKIVEEITLSNSACYFFIYAITGKHFRDRVVAIFDVRRCSRCKHARQKKRTGDSKYYVAVSKMEHVTNGNTIETNV
ncbi:FMRFamide receptor-like [Gigantopelta aegis]|uniref:FMRFamide receptor-like n=1 Tax=Gigantopelta aegis TaxID=1735272 RepID=UPI001B88B615|nr:FMRFamide receptor-like [Gigantopelta aegis]